VGGKEKEGRVGWRGRGEDVEGPGKWSAPGPVLALGGPGPSQGQSFKAEAKAKPWTFAAKAKSFKHTAIKIPVRYATHVRHPRRKANELNVDRF